MQSLGVSALTLTAACSAEWLCWALLLVAAFHSTPHLAGEGCAGLHMAAIEHYRQQNYFGSLEQVGTFEFRCPRGCIGS